MRPHQKAPVSESRFFYLLLTGFLICSSVFVPLGIHSSLFAADLFVVDQGNVDVREFDASTAALNGVVEGTTGNLVDPFDIAFHPATGQLFISDTGTDDVRIFSQAAAADSGGSPQLDFIGSFGQTAAFLADPRGLAFHPIDDRLFVVDAVHGDVRVFNGSTGDFITTFGSANLTTPVDIAFHPATDNFLVADTTTHDIREFDKNTGAFLGVFGQTASNLVTPIQIIFVPSSTNLLVSDPGNGDVREFDGGTGDFVGIIKDNSGNFMPHGLAFNPITNNLLVADTGNDDIREFDTAGGTFLGFFAGANLANPLGMAVEPDDLFPSGLKVMPTTGQQWLGFFGGTFSPTSNKYDLQNKRATTESYLVTLQYNDPGVTPWLDLAGTTSGTLALNEEAEFTYTLNTDASSLDPGIYTATITFSFVGDSTAVTMRKLSLLVGADSTKPLALENKNFMPACIRGECNQISETYGLTNFGTTTATYTATTDQNWLNLQIGAPDPATDGVPASGDLPVPTTDTVNGSTKSGETTMLTVSVNSNAASITQDSTATLTVTNNGNSGNTETETITLVLASDPLSQTSKNRIMSPYWQADSGSYTFLVVSHPSLTGMNSRIGVVMTTIENDGAPFGSPAEFTVSNGQSKRIFIVTTNNAVANPTAQPDASFITGPDEDASAHGQLVVTGGVSDPTVLLPGPTNVPGRGPADIRLLHFWGAVVIQETATGFAMEFVGDNQDSRAFNTPNFSGVN